MDYPSHWRMAYLAAFFAHLAVWLFMSLAMPHLLRSIPEPPLEQEIEWTDMAAFSGELPAGGQDKGEAFDIPAQETAELPEKVRVSLLDDAETVFVLRGDRKTSYENMVSVLDVLKRSGTRHVSIATEQRKE